MNTGTNSIEFHVRERSLMGKKVSQLRKSGYVPANIYGLGKDSMAIDCEQGPFEKLLRDHGEQGLMYLVVGDAKKKVPVLIDEVEYHPLTQVPQHISFRRVSLKEAVETEVPLEVIGEVDIKNAIVEQVRDYLPIKALPTEIPDSIEIDISSLTKVGDSVMVSDLLIDTTKIEVLLSEEELESPLVLVQEVQEEPEEEPESEVGEEDQESEAATDESEDLDSDEESSDKE